MDLNSRQYVVSLDMTRTGSIRESFEMRHNDDNELIIELRDSAGIIDLNASGVINATLLVTRKDKVDIPLAGTITPEGRASFKLKRASLEKQGMVEVVAQFYFANDVRISTPTLIFNVLRDPSAGDVGDEGDDRTLIEVILNDAPALLEQLQTAYDELQIQKAAFAQFQTDSETAFSNAQNQRSTDFNADQAARSTAFEDAQTQRATDFNTSQGERTTLFNQAQTARQNDYQTWKDAKDTELNQLASDTENSKLAADGATTNANNAATAANSAATNANNKVTELNGYNTRLQAEETETANARQSAAKGKNFASLDARFEELESDTYKPMQNLVANGNFANGTTGWTSPNATSFSVTANEATFTATAQAGNIQTPLTIGNVGDKIYVRAEVKATSNLVLLNNAGILATAFHSGSGQYEVLSSVFNSTGGSTSIRVQDNRSSGWNAISAKKFIEINLTAHFGAGKEPSKEEMDRLLTVHYDGWFDGTTNVAKKLLELSAQQLTDTFVPMKNEVVNGDFSQGPTSNISVTNGTISFASGVATVTSDGSATFSRLRLLKVLDSLTDIYYTIVRARVTNSNATSISFHDGYGMNGNSVQSPVVNTWYTLSARSSVPYANPSRDFYVYQTYADPATSNGKVLEVDYVLIINLTKTFGAGNEPTKEEMDRLLAKYPNSFFDGTVNLTPKLLDDLRYLTSDIQMPVVNKMPNADFSNVITGWAGSGGTVSAATPGVLSVSGSGSSAEPSAYFLIGAGLGNATGDKIYVSFKVRVTNPDCNLISFYAGRIAGGTKFTVTNNPIQNTWYRGSGLSDIADYANFHVYARYIDATTANGKVMEIDDVLLINLTQVFGAGNEPTQAQMDALLATYPNSWFDGTVNLSENKRIIPFLLKRLELKADKVQEAWITPTLLNGATGTVQYRKNQFGRVEFRGTLTVTASGSVAFNLPTGYRILNDTRITVGCTDNTATVVAIFTDGNVFVVNASKTAMLNAISVV